MTKQIKPQNFWIVYKNYVMAGLTMQTKTLM